MTGLRSSWMRATVILFSIIFDIVHPSLAETMKTKEVNTPPACGPGTNNTCQSSVGDIPISQNDRLVRTPGFVADAMRLDGLAQRATPPTQAPTSLPSPDDSGLKNCNVPVAQLRAKCTDGYSCVNYSPSQFPEVVKIERHDGNRIYTCTGTLISPNWILTAAHCESMTPVSQLVTQKGSDYLFPNPETIDITAANAFSLPEAGRKRNPDKVILYSKASPVGQTQNDLALMHVKVPYSALNVPPAMLVPLNAKFVSQTTDAGYGYSDGISSRNGFAIAWLPPLTKTPIFLEFKPSNGVDYSLHGAFCQGDSGGPAFSGVARGCKMTDVDKEGRPRVIEGINAWVGPGSMDPQDPAEKRIIEQCKSAQDALITSLLVVARHNWICGITEKAAGGCS